jgi:hypothetical protein
MKPGERLKQARVNAGFKTARAAARTFGWVEPTYLAHENEGRGLRADQARMYAKALGVPFIWLLHGDQDLQPPMPSKVVYEREILLEVIAASFQCLTDLPVGQAEGFAQAVLEVAERQQALPESKREKDFVRSLAVAAARLFARAKP